MGQACSAEENAPQRRRKLNVDSGSLDDPNLGVRAGFRVSDRCRAASYGHVKNPVLRVDAARHAEATALDVNARDQVGVAAATTPRSDEQGSLLGSRDVENVEFLEAVKGLMDGAVKLAGADKGIGTRIMSGLMRKTGVVDSFVDSMVAFVDRRLSTLTEALEPKDIACTVAASLRKHVQTHDAFTDALGIRAGRKRSVNGMANARRESSVVSDRPEDVDRSDVDIGHENDRDDEIRDELEEDKVEVVQLWQAWKHCGGFWPSQMPDPDHASFEGDDGATDFISMLDDGVHAFLQETSKHLLQTALPEDAEELRLAVGATTPRRGGKSETDAARTAMEVANRLSQLKSSVLEPMLCQVLHQQIIRRFCESAKLWQLVLRVFCPDAEVSSIGHDLKHLETFSLMAEALGKIGNTSESSLRMDLMQGLIKMAWGSGERKSPASSSSRGGQETSSQSGRVNTSDCPTTTRATSDALDNIAGIRTMSQRPDLHQDESQKQLRDRLGSNASSQWSDVEFGSDFGWGDIGFLSPGVRPPSPRAPTPRAASSMTGGARDIFNVPYAEQLSQGLVGSKKDKCDEDLEARALEEIQLAWEAEMTKNFPLAVRLYPATWVEDRARASRALVRRPTNLMLVLSVLDAVKDVLRAAGDTVHHASTTTLNITIPRETARVTFKNISNTSRGGMAASASPTAALPEEEIKRDNQELHESVDPIQRAIGGREKISRVKGRKGTGAKRNTPGWRAWEARRSWFFGSDMGVVGLHFGRSLLGEETVGLGDFILKMCSLEYSSLEGVIRDETWKAIQTCFDMQTADVLVRMKPMSTQPILYVSSQMRMLRALKKTGLDFSKSLGDGPQKSALSGRFESYCWIFTDALIDKLTVMKTIDAARSRALISSDDPVDGEGGNAGVISRDGTARELDKQAATGVSRARELKREKRRIKNDVLLEMTSFRSSKDLLKALLTSWLPQVLAADRE